MAPKSSHSSHASLVSIDSVVAGQITSPAEATQPSHMRTGSTPVVKNPASTFAYAKGHERNKSAPSRNMKRSNSLRRAKNSTEVLRQRSTKKDKSTHSEQSTDSKRGRNFAVTNVGTGGTLYLRPSAYQRPMSPTLSPAPSTPWTAPASTLVMPDQNETVLLTTEQNPLGRGPTIRTRSVSPKRLLDRFNKTKEAQARSNRPHHGRSLSFSTVGESRRSVDSIPRTLKIVINRADHGRPKTTESGKPTLEIPIPHYRLGNPRFSSNGTPILRSSTFTRNSSTPSERRTSLLKTEVSSAGPPPSSLKAFAKLQPFELSSHAGLQIQPAGTNNPNFAQTRTSTVSSIGAAPSIYDELSHVYDDPSVVRFAHNIREVTAATPARIIAQISSESFMDYELVSDFFLTFRSYMSTVDVLDLLLARLKWAIGRMTDDGRIIRIRTFAALRHWILNYFTDDFVPNRFLRERFCDEVNDMYDDVHSQYMGAQSDLKILQDLKRCWNGRCSLYWDGEEFNMDGDPDEEIYPGGVIGSRNPDYISPREVNVVLDQTPLQNSQSVPGVSALSEMRQPGTGELHRQPKSSFASSRPPESMQSEFSLQPRSCSIPLSSKNQATSKKRGSQGPVPVSVLARRLNAPAELTVATNLVGGQKSHHRRGGNSIDSTRDRASMEVPGSALLAPEPHEGSVIRGHLYPPVEPFVQLPVSFPQSPSGKFDLPSAGSSGTRLPQDHSLGASNPAVKNIFGSIRRALGGKQDFGGDAFITISTHSNTGIHEGKKSPMPLNVSRSQDELRKKTLNNLPKVNIRIDLLCAAAVESYQAAQKLQQQRRQLHASEPQLDVLKSDTLFPPPPTHQRQGTGDNRASEASSHSSAESGSILIVNDTDSEIPIMSGALQPTLRRTSHRTRSSVEHYLPDGHASCDTQMAFRNSNDNDRDQHEDAVHEDDIIDEEVPQPKTPDQKTSPEVKSQMDVLISSADSADTEHRLPSALNSPVRNPLLTSPGPTISTVTPPRDYYDEESMSSPKAAGQTLRRRPGGDLRKNQNVHELEPTPVHHESIGSYGRAYSAVVDPPAVAEVMARTQEIASQHHSRISMINTHSSQHLRPSFEAAISGFSTIPDDDDGGLEATLLKLEGRYDKSPEIESYSPTLANTNRFSDDEPLYERSENIPSSSPIPVREQIHQRTPGTPSRASNGNVASERYVKPQSPLAKQNMVSGLQIQSIVRSEASTDSVPLLKRDIDDVQTIDSSRHIDSTSEKSLLPKYQKSNSLEGQGLRDPSPGSYLTADNSNTHSGQSMLIEDDDRSDLSSEISVDIINYSEALGSTSSPLLVAPGTAVSGLEIPSHPLAHSSFVNLSLHPSLALDGKASTIANPKASEPILLKIGAADTTVIRSNLAAESRLNAQRGAKISAGPAHVPFVLACDSQMLAQQLTLVEQSALTEIEWFDLVEMRWSSTAANVFDWPEYVANRNANGIDVIITRFNLMVKWTLSEIVLTQNVDERVRVITKFIHVAAHARRLHNYATMLQLTIALTSSDCTRMTKTWDLVPGPDKSLLKNMEALIQPVRNFHDLRLEMESADLSDGCIPFIGLYIHDLTYNAQKPVEIDTGKGHLPLINFERFRTTAVIVKGLLRLIDASSRYDFEPIHGVIERCLWIAALPDEKIRSLSRSLQQAVVLATD